MKKFKRVLFGYNKDDVDAAISSYEKIIEINNKNIAYLSKKLDGLKQNEKQPRKNSTNEMSIDKQTIEDIQSTINK